MSIKRAICWIVGHDYPITSGSDIAGNIETQVLVRHEKCVRCGHGDGASVVIATHHFRLGPRVVHPVRWRDIED